MLLISADEYFNNSYSVISDLTENEYLISGITGPRDIYWKVSSMSDIGGFSAWSEVRHVHLN